MATEKRARAQLSPAGNAHLIEQPSRDETKVKRPPGRPQGALGKLTREAVEHAKATGEMPHYFLLRIARGEIIEQDVMNPLTGEVTKTYHCPDLDRRIDAAKACANYFAPKLATIEQSQALSDEQLLDDIRNLGAACGVAISFDGTRETRGAEEAGTGGTEDSWI